MLADAMLRFFGILYVNKKYKNGGENMSSQMEQFFKVLLCLVMVALLIGVGSKYLESNYAKFDVKRYR